MAGRIRSGGLQTRGAPVGESSDKMSASGMGLQWGDPRLSITTTRKIDPRHAYIAKRLKDAIGAARERISVNATPLPATPNSLVGHSGPRVP